MFGNTWESPGAGWLLPHAELILCPAGLEFLLLRPIRHDFITVNLKGVRLLLNRSPINYLCWTLYKGPIFYLILCPCDWYAGNGNLCLQAVYVSDEGSRVFCCPENSGKLRDIACIFPYSFFLIEVCIQSIIANVFSKLLVYFFKGLNGETP